MGMEKRGVLITLILAICLQCGVVLCVPKLELATLVYRHGDRTPIKTWPTDPNAKESLWPQGYGQLTVRGMKQQYFLGGLFFERYINTTYPAFLSKNYTRTQLSIRATDVDRTLMSAEVQLSSLFHPEPEQMFEEDLPWQPIPVHTVPMEDDILLRAFDADCPYYQLLLRETYASPDYLQLEAQNKDLLVFLRDKTGIPNLEFNDIWFVEDTLFIENIYNVTPTWYTPELFNRIKNISDYTLSLMFNSVEKSRLSAGVFIGQLVSTMNATVTGNVQLNQMKMYMYSAHDTTLAAVMTALGVYNKVQPPYAAALMIELFSENSNFFVKCFYRNDTASSNIQELYIPGCGSTSCNWTQFVAFTSGLIPNNWAAECQLPSPTPYPPSSSSQLAPSETAAITLGILLGCVILLVMLLSIVTLFKRQRKVYHADDSRAPLMMGKESF